MAPQYLIELAAAIKLTDGIKTSSLFPTSKERSAKCKAEVPLIVAVQNLDFVNLAIFFQILKQNFHM